MLTLTSWDSNRRIFAGSSMSIKTNAKQGFSAFTGLTLMMTAIPSQGFSSGTLVRAFSVHCHSPMSLRFQGPVYR